MHLFRANLPAILLNKHNNNKDTALITVPDPPSPFEKSKMPKAAFSFGGLGTAGAENEAFALFSFDSNEAYDAYRAKVSHDEACIALTEKFEKTPCFTGYKRSFLTPAFS